MIKIARKKYPETSFSVCDIAKPLPFGSCSFDIVFCNQVLMDIDDIGGTLSECRRILKPEGVFYFAIVHPAFYDGTIKNNDLPLFFFAECKASGE